MLASKVSTSPSTSYIAFLLGACVVSQSQELQKAVSLTSPLTVVFRVVMSPWIVVMSPFMSLMSCAAHPEAVCKSEMSPCILVMLLFMLFTAVATAQFWIAFVELVFRVASITGLLFKSWKFPVSATVLTLLAQSLLFHVAFSVGLTNKLLLLSWM